MCFSYLINDEIEFRPSFNQLISKEDEHQQVILPAPASRCLLLLLQTRMLVTQQELFYFAWGESSDSVTPNNLYQNISLLRRALKSITAADNDWIITVPRKGFRLDNSLDIVELDNPVERNVTNLPVDEDLPDITEGKKGWPFGRHASWVFYGLLCALFGGAMLLADHVLFPAPELIDDFVFFERAGDCKLYINKDTQDSHTHLQAFSTVNVNCLARPYNYITAYKFLHSATVFSCNKPINQESSHCISRLIRGFKVS